MQKFNIFIVLTLSALSLSGCVSDKPTRENQDAATFELERVEGKSFVSDLSEVGLPNRRTFTFTACIKDIRQYKSIPHHNFSITGSGQYISVKSDTNGCISWSEQLTFDLGREPKWLTVERGVKAEGVHKGQRLLSLAINPWLDDQSKMPSVVDLRYEKSVLPADKILAKNESYKALKWTRGEIPYADRAQLWVSNVHVTVQEKSFASGPKGGAEFSFQLEFEPKIRVKDFYGNYTLLNLARSSLDIKPFLIASALNKQNEKIIINEDIAAIRVQSDQSSVRQTFTIKIPFAPNGGSIELGLRILFPNDMSVLPFEGTFDLGSLSNLVGRKIADLSPEVEKIYQNIQVSRMKWDKGNRLGLSEQSLAVDLFSKISGLKTVESADGFGKIAYRLSRPKVNFSAISKDECESAVQREVQYQVETCVINPLTAKGVPFTKFKVSLIQADGSLKLIEEDTTLHDGCLIWENSQKHSYYSRERYIVNRFVVENEALKFKEEMKIAINPWDYGFTFGRDAAQLNNLITNESFSPSASEGQNRKIKDSPQPELVLHNFSSNFLEQTYIIDDDLNMDVKRTYRYQFIPRVLRHDSLIAGVSNRADLRDGIYMVRFVLARHRQESGKDKNGVAFHPEEEKKVSQIKSQLGESVAPVRPSVLPDYINHYEVPVMVRDGHITVDVDFTMRELYLLGSRNSIFIQVKPVDPQGLAFLPGSGCKVDVKRSVFNVEKNSDFKTWTYEAPQVLLESTGAGIFRQVAFAADEIIANAQNSQLFKQVQEFNQPAATTTAKSKEEQFAAREGLRLVDFTNSKLISSFSGALSWSARKFNELQQKENYGISPSEQEAIIKKMAESSDDPKKALRAQLNFLEKSYDLNRDLYGKMRNFLFKEITENDLKEVILTGVHAQNASVPQISNFAHLMCSFWFDNFYSQYMSQEQIQSMGKWLEKKDSVKSVEEWLRVDGTIYSRPLKPGYPFLEEYNYGSTKSHVLSTVREVMHGRLFNNHITRCLQNPYAFFAFEKKIMISKVASSGPNNITYVGGDTQNYTVNQAFRIDHNFGWDSSRNYNFSVGGSFATADALFSFMKSLKYVSFAGIRLGGDWSANRSEKTGRYRAQSLNFSKGPWLTVTRSNFEIELANYRHCLTIRPKVAAFEGMERFWRPEFKNKTADQMPYKRAGVMICTESMTEEPNRQPMKIVESYYYLAQQFATGTYLQDSALIYNRPFLLSMRGSSEFDKFLLLTEGVVEPNFKGRQSMPGSLYDNKVDPLVGLIEAFKTTKAMDRTGFYPGVYSVIADENQEFKDKQGKDFWKVFELIADQHPLGWIGFGDEGK